LKARISGTKPVLREQGFKYGDYEDKFGIVAGTDENNCAKIRISMNEIISVPMQYVVPLNPTLTGEHVVGVVEKITGCEYTVVKFGPLECGLKLRGKRGSKIDENLRTDWLCVVL
jgi:hypothetical protein